jgi:protein required for attachment to host cells
MIRTCIAVADASRARLFVLDRSMDVEGLRETLREERSLVNPARRLPQSELFSDTRAGVNHAGGLQYAIDDHREQHIANMDAEFARLVASELGELLRLTPMDRLILCASPHMLGHLRDARGGALADAEIPRDLVKLAPNELREQLADYGVLPPKPPSV